VVHVDDIPGVPLQRAKVATEAKANSENLMLDNRIERGPNKGKGRGKDGRGVKEGRRKKEES